MENVVGRSVYVCGSVCHAYLDAFVLVIYTYRPAVRLITHTVSEGRCLNFNKVEQSDNQTPLRRATVSDSFYITLICNALESRSDSKSEKCLPLKLNEATRLKARRLTTVEIFV